MSDYHSGNTMSSYDESHAPLDRKNKGVLVDDHESRLNCFLCGDDRLKTMSNCGHIVCDECIKPFITDIVKKCGCEFKCPKEGCSDIWTMERCLLYVPEEVGERWMLAVCEARTLANPQCIVCPSRTCGAVVINDHRGYLIRACTSCWCVFCARCGVDWHFGMSCDEYQALAQAADQIYFP